MPEETLCDYTEERMVNLAEHIVETMSYEQMASVIKTHLMSEYESSPSRFQWDLEQHLVTN